MIQQNGASLSSGHFYSLEKNQDITGIRRLCTPLVDNFVILSSENSYIGRLKKVKCTWPKGPLLCEYFFLLNTSYKLISWNRLCKSNHFLPLQYQTQNNTYVLKVLELLPSSTKPNSLCLEWIWQFLCSQLLFTLIQLRWTWSANTKAAFK